MSLRPLPLGYTVEIDTLVTHYATYYDERGHQVYWYTRDTEGAREEVWRGYYERVAKQKQTNTITEAKGAT